MSAKLVPFRPLRAVADPDQAATEAKVRKLERTVRRRMWAYRAKRFASDWWPFVVLPISILLMIREAFR